MFPTIADVPHRKIEKKLLARSAKNRWDVGRPLWSEIYSIYASTHEVSGFTHSSRNVPPRELDYLLYVSVKDLT